MAEHLPGDPGADGRDRGLADGDMRVVEDGKPGAPGLPRARVELLPGVGHTPMMEDPQATGTLLLELAAAAANHS